MILLLSPPLREESHAVAEGVHLRRNERKIEKDHPRANRESEKTL